MPPLSRIVLGCIIGVLALIALVLRLQQEPESDSGEAAASGPVRQEVASASAEQQNALSPGNPPKPVVVVSPPSAQAASPPEAAAAPSAHPTEGAPLDGSKEQASVAPVQAEAVDATGVSAAHPFTLSASVQAACKEDIFHCKALYEDVAKLAQEPRDPPWSAEMEKKLRGFVGTQQGGFTIRSLECRTSVCAIEVASMYGPLPLPRNNSDLASRVFEQAQMFGYENNVPSGTTVVTFQTFERMYR